MEIKIDIENCRGCPHFMSTLYPAQDSWERPEYWWCKESDKQARSDSAETVRVNIKTTSNLSKLRYIAGYVEWNDKIPVPNWCPCKI